jgi:shikimate kinase
MKIFLAGFMGSGKTILGNKLAKRLKIEHIDLDNLIIQESKMSIAKFFNDKGEDYFREFESELLKRICKKENFVLSLGGGTPCFLNNLETIQANGMSIYLKASNEQLFNRLYVRPLRTYSNYKIAENNIRPLIHGLDETQLKKFISKSLDERESAYKKCNFTVDVNGKKLIPLTNELHECVKKFYKLS